MCGTEHSGPRSCPPTAAHSTGGCLSWHLLTVDEHERVMACIRYCAHRPGVSFSDLAISQSAVLGRPNSDERCGKLSKVSLPLRAGGVLLCRARRLGHFRADAVQF